MMPLGQPSPPHGEEWDQVYYSDLEVVLTATEMHVNFLNYILILHIYMNVYKNTSNVYI